MTRTEKWRYKRVQLDVERQKLATTLLNVSEELATLHSEIYSKTFNEMMGNPIPKIEKIFKIGE